MAKKPSKDKDPFLGREAASYTHPVPSREFIIEYLEEYAKPATLKHLINTFDLKTKEENEGIRRRLKAMERDGQLIANRRGSYALVTQMELVKGRVSGHREGFGFLIPEDGSRDIFLSARQMRAVFPDDQVLVRVTGTDARQRREGVVVEVLERNTQKTVGRYFKESSVAFVSPDNKAITQDIIIENADDFSLKKGQFVEVEITEQPSLRRQPMGKIVKILGDQLTPGVEVELAVRAYNLPFEWPEALLKEAASIKSVLSPKDYENRKDLRSLAFVTIDGEDAKDFDDAVYCEVLKEGWKLYVAIADVAYYVKPESAIDEEAVQRGNSVYFPNRVIPMLPEILSNELCSLKPKVDRLAMVCEIEIGADGKLLNHHFSNAIIHSQARLTYTQVATWLNENKAPAEFSDIFPRLKELNHLYKKLLQQRELRGAIDFDTVETRIIFDEKGKIDRIVPTERNEAHRLIEEMMLLANVCASKFVQKAKIEALYRNHELPDEQKLSSLRDFMQAFGLRLEGGDEPTAMDYANLLERIQKRPDAHLLQTVLLRSLKQAHYSPTNAGHFGLAFDGYCHFTSPIRRYPDLLLHRAIKHVLSKADPKKFPVTNMRMQQLGDHFSLTERRADRATRDALDWLKCDYMKDKVGKTFDGVISDVTGFGVFVQLKDIYIEGLLHVTALKNDYYHHDAIHHSLVGKQSGQIYRLGDAIKVEVVRVDLDDRQIEFDLA